MKKLVAKDKNIRFSFKHLQKKCFVLKSILKNQNFFLLIRKKASFYLRNLAKLCSSVLMVNRCVQTHNKKRFNKYTLFCRFLYLKLIRHGQITGFQKSSW